MKKILLCLFITSIFISSCVTSSNFTELIENGDASQGVEKWGLYVNPPGKAIIKSEDEQIIYSIDKVGKENWHIQGHYAGLEFIKGASYTLSVDMASTLPRDAQIRIQLDSSPYTAYLEEDIKLTENMTTFTFNFIMSEPTDEFAKLCFNIGWFDGMPETPHEVIVDNLSISVDNSTITKDKEIKSEFIVSINQIGYNPSSIKEVRINSETDIYNIKSTDTDKIVYTGEFSQGIDDPASGEMVYVGNFSDFNTKGEYYIDIPELGRSYNFKIEDNRYADLYNAAIKMFYYQKCGELLTEDLAGVWSHNACHIDDATIYGSNKKLDVTGGWHDAGDYGRYVSPGVKAVADLFIASEYNKNILDIARYELDWLLKMQDKDSGGVYHKVTTANFIGSVMPDKNSDELLISPISSTATGAFTAIMAKASRLYKNIDPTFSDRALESALKSWSWLQLNSDYPGFINPEGIVTGEYGDEIDGDERFWAAIELYLTTGDSNFEDYAIDSYLKNSWSGQSWADVGTYGLISYIFNKKENSEFKLQLTTDFLNQAEKLSNSSSTDGYGVSLGVDYQWGSNGVIADNALNLLLAYELNENSLYSEQAERHIHYLLGANSLGQSYISGFGGKSVENPHHRPTNATGEVVPGMLAGGPNKSLQDPLAKSQLSEAAPAKCYLDAEPSYSTNEITIYWNSPLVAALSALQ